MLHYIVGIDEAGRGPLAGPVAVGVVALSRDFDWTLIPGVGDSKQVSEKKRALVFNRAKELKKSEVLDFAVIMMSAKHIDTYGIARSIATAIDRAIHKLSLDPKNSFIKLDGSLKAPAEFAQQTIIKGDQTELVIGLASILAKETRDAYMHRLAKKNPEYGFEIHKGYGTKAHRHMIKQFGLCPEHRKSYCRNKNVW